MRIAQLRVEQEIPAEALSGAGCKRSWYRSATAALPLDKWEERINIEVI
jgi:hypothetical protein